MKMTNGALTNAGMPTSNQYWTRPLPFQGSAPDGDAVSSSSRSSAVSLKLARPGVNADRVAFTSPKVLRVSLKIA